MLARHFVERSCCPQRLPGLKLTHIHDASAIPSSPMRALISYRASWLGSAPSPCSESPSSRIRLESKFTVCSKLRQIESCQSFHFAARTIWSWPQNLPDCNDDSPPFSWGLH